MIRSTILFLCLLMILDLDAQCKDADWHNTSVTDIWLSCQRQPNPVADIDRSHWIQYEFDEPTTFDGVKVWNVTHPEFFVLGSNQIRLDYSIDGSSWTQWTSARLETSPDPYTYSGEELSDITTITAQYIIVSITEERDLNCAGLAEIRFSIGDATTSTDDLATEETFSIFPNPADQLVTIDLPLEYTDEVFYTLVDESGRQILQKVDQGKTTLDVTSLADGVYFLNAKVGAKTLTQQFIVTHSK